jgi:hypothetical protein
VDTSTGIALAALAISLITGGVQVATWWSGRHRVTVSCETTTVGLPAADGRTVNHTYVRLRVRNVGRDVAVDGIEFQLRDGAEGVQGLVWGSPPEEALQLTPFRALPSRLTRSELVSDGESRTWVCTLDASPFFGEMRGFEAVAVAELSNGKRISSDPFWHRQTPPTGWILPHDGAQPHGPSVT